MNYNQNNATKIAIVDEHPLLRKYLLYWLTTWKYSIIIEACNGKELLDKLSENKLPDICILDLNMPVLNGYETIKILRESWPGIKILVYSMDITRRTLASSLNADAVISKTKRIAKIEEALQLLIASNK